MANSLGLHKEFPDWKISLLDREMRRRAVWHLYIFDSGASITLGRPILQPDFDVMDVQEPLNIHDEHLTPATRILPPESKESTLYSSLLMQLRFHKLTNPMYSRRIASTDISADELLAMDAKITAWLATAPSYFQKSTQLDNPPEWLLLARYRFIWRVRNFRILLLCPVLLRWASEKARGISTSENDNKDEMLCRKLCLSYAYQTISSIVEYFGRNIFSPLGDWYAAYSALQATLINILFMFADPENISAGEWFADVEATKQVLEPVGSRDPLARKFLDVVDRFCPSMDGFTAFAASDMVDGVMDGTAGLHQEQLLTQIYMQFQGSHSATPQSMW